MARCNDCNKFCSLDQGDPEAEEPEIDENGHVSCEVRITTNCSDCGTEINESGLSLEGDAEIPEGCRGGAEGHELSAEVQDVEATSRSEGKGRGVRTFYGAEVTISWSCSCKAEEAHGQLVVGDDVQASSMDEC